MIGHVIRIALTIALLVMVWREAGVWTSLALTMLAIANEANGAIVCWHGRQIRAISPATETLLQHALRSNR